jgi:hypothetical protein
MTNIDEQHPGYVRLQIDMEYDARSQGYFIKAPENFPTMDEASRQAWLDRRAQEYLDEQVEAHGTYYATAEEAAEDNQGGWSLAFDPDDVEDES